MTGVMFNLRKLQKSKTVKYGIPMILLVVGGSFGLREFTQIRYDAQRIKKRIFAHLGHRNLYHRLDPSLEAKVNIQKQSVMLEEEYEKMKQVNLDNWQNIRGPRPWEDSKEYQDQQRRNLHKTE